MMRKIKSFILLATAIFAAHRALVVYFENKVMEILHAQPDV